MVYKRTKHTKINIFIQSTAKTNAHKIAHNADKEHTHPAPTPPTPHPPHTHSHTLG